MDGVSVVLGDGRASTDLVEPIYCREGEKRPSLVVFSQTEAGDGGGGRDIVTEMTCVTLCHSIRRSHENGLLYDPRRCSDELYSASFGAASLE